MINNLPDELLVEIFDFYRQGEFNFCPWRQAYEDNYYHWWSMKLEWFKLIHVCKRWRTVIFASSSRLDLCFVFTSRSELGYQKKSNMKTILSRHFPPLPLAIDYRPSPLPLCSFLDARDIGRMLAAFKRPDRIRAITLIATTSIFDKFFKATKCPFPALESLELRNPIQSLNIPVKFLEGSNHPNLRTLKLHRIYLPPTLQLLSSASALTHLSLVTDTFIVPLTAMSLILCLQGMPCLCHLNLEMTSLIDGMKQPTENFSLSKLTFFHYRGYSAFLNSLTAVLAVPSLREVDISLSDTTRFTFPHIIRFINDIEEHFYAFKFILNYNCLDLLFFTHSEFVGHHTPRFTLHSNNIFELLPQLSTAFSAKLIAVQEVFVFFEGISTDPDNEDYDEEYFIPWRGFLLQFPGVKALHLEGDCLQVANALQEGGGGPLAFSALEEIELCSRSSVSVDEQQSPSEQVAIFQPFVSVRQKAGLPIKVFCGKSLPDPPKFRWWL
jgi:hypothetical protein